MADRSQTSVCCTWSPSPLRFSHYTQLALLRLFRYRDPWAAMKMIKLSSLP